VKQGIEKFIEEEVDNIEEVWYCLQ
jgi:hypothetical protein